MAIHKFFYIKYHVLVLADLMFGKYYVYEGIAYELDREVDKIKVNISVIEFFIRKTYNNH